MVFKRLAILGGIICIVGILAGCAGQGGDSNRQPTGSEQVQGNTPEVVKTGQSLVQNQETPARLPSTPEKTMVVVYFGNDQGYLVPVKREVPKVQGIARAAVLELIKGPGPNSALEPIMPEGTILRDINIKDNGLVIVDFSSEFKAKHGGGSTGESQTVYSIVNTLTQFPSIKEVQILVEGEKLETLAGHIAINRPLERNSNIIQALKE